MGAGVAEFEGEGGGGGAEVAGGFEFEPGAEGGGERGAGPGGGGGGTGGGVEGAPGGLGGERRGGGGEAGAGGGEGGEGGDVADGEAGGLGGREGQGGADDGRHDFADTGVVEAVDEAAGAGIRDVGKSELGGIVGGEVAAQVGLGVVVVATGRGHFVGEIARDEVVQAVGEGERPGGGEGGEEKRAGAETGDGGRRTGDRGEEPGEAEAVDHGAEGQRIHVTGRGKAGAGAAGVGGGEELDEDPAAEGDEDLAGDGRGGTVRRGGGGWTDVRPTPEDAPGGEEPREPEDGGECVAALGDGPLEAVDEGEDEIVQRLRLHVGVVVDLDAGEGAGGDEGGAQDEGGPGGAEGGFAAEEAEDQHDDDDGGGEEAGAHREEGERGGGGAGPPRESPRAGEREGDDGGERGGEEPVLLGVEAAEDVLPGEGETEKGDGEEPEGGEKERRREGERGRRG